jgi:hypothetical protein
MKIPNIVEIMQAWKIRYNPTDEQQEIAERRAVVCDTCEFKDLKKLTRNFVCGA